jgi:NADH-quinone oxidoreductase subunit J
VTGTSFIFWIVALVTVASAATVVFSKNLIYSAVALLFTLSGVAGLYVFLWADFIAVTQILIYVGGILVLIIFGIMLTHRITNVRLSHSSIQQGVGGTIVLVIFLGLTSMILKAPWYRVTAVEPQENHQNDGATDTLLNRGVGQPDVGDPMSKHNTENNENQYSPHVNENLSHSNKVRPKENIESSYT